MDPPRDPWPHLRPEWTPAPRRWSLKEVADGHFRRSGLLGRVTGQAAGCLAGSHRRRPRRCCSDGGLLLAEARPAVSEVPSVVEQGHRAAEVLQHAGALVCCCGSERGRPRRKVSPLHPSRACACVPMLPTRGRVACCASTALAPMAHALRAGLTSFISALAACAPNVKPFMSTRRTSLPSTCPHRTAQPWLK